ncbi:phosphoribosylanthranilate isomerase [Alicyclobacillus dauci]|uniref:N-(5'-phosphoribosyl)anthranilate isomerase n=1 Tax=Alicyclobacillus dauci TaxID=1475485 RepID=A0ABY6YX21_9BACL|nr:phosphoribosylanthranilate isomerase [Alicyclobacillus dauci]WAH35127.1 phosphoribosylanthranilate isomerase [Alicyclobacillus dauci]
MTTQAQVKICGLRPGDDLQFTAHPFVTHVGIIFVPPSKRYVDPAAARTITSNVHHSCRTVGVFANAPMADVLKVVRESGVRVAQLHGDESVADCTVLRDAGLDVWKVLKVPTTVTQGADLDRLTREIELYADVTNGLLLDASPPTGAKVTGGYGRTFDWSCLQQLTPHLVGMNWWVAGGIGPDNVRSLLDSCQPTGVDVSSGVEVDGRKNTQRIVQLLEAVNG